VPTHIVKMQGALRGGVKVQRFWGKHGGGGTLIRQRRALGALSARYAWSGGKHGGSG